MYKPIDKDVVLRLVQSKGPLIPNHIRKELNTDTIMVGAVLSQLISEGKLKVTSVKIGGSPNYYAPGSEDKLVDLIRYLNEKDRRVAEMLKEQKVMKDSDQDPLVRVSLRNIKDYAKPLEVVIKGSKEIYWKWYLLATKDAEELISGKVKPKKVEEKKEAPPAVEIAPVEKEPNTIIVDSKSEIDSDEKKHEVKKDEKPKKARKPRQTKLKETIPEVPTSFGVIASGKPFEGQSKLAKPSIMLNEETDEFFNEVRSYLEQNEIAIVDYKIPRKGELELVIFVPTKIGTQEYFCKAKKKKKLSDDELNAAYIQGQQMNLPVVYLFQGDINKKMKDSLSSKFRGMIVRRIS